MISRFIKDLKEPLEIPLQMVAVEMDTSAKRIKYINSNLCTDKIDNDRFCELVRSIESGEVASEISSIDDNTVLYEFEEEAVVIYSYLGIKWLLFDSFIASKIEKYLIHITCC